jgi:RNA binding exosome subunit
MEFGSTRIRIIFEPGEESLIERAIEKVCALVHFDLAAFRAEHPGEPIRTKRFEIAVSRAQGLIGQLFVLTAQVRSKKDAALLFDELIETLDPKERMMLRSTIPSRTDDELRCFVRIDKALFLNGVCALVDHGRCVHFSFTILTYPKSREQAIRFLEGYLAEK